METKLHLDQQDIVDALGEYAIKRGYSLSGKVEIKTQFDTREPSGQKIEAWIELKEEKEKAHG